jgi:hypothetical protein
MRNDIKVDVTVGTLASMSVEQFTALRDNILREGNWETADGIRVSGGGDYIGVVPLRAKRASADFTGAMEQMMFIGIERDGYTHS